MLTFVCALGLLGAVATSTQPAADAAPTGIDQVFVRLYNLDFAGAHSVLETEMNLRPDDPLVHAVHGAIHLFSEFSRLSILESEFFIDDDRVTDRKRLKPDPAVRADLFRATSEARKLATAQLEANPTDSNALFALCMATGLETDYVGLIEHRYVRTYSLSKESQGSAHTLLALDPPWYDAYLTLGSAEYVVSNLNFIFRLFVRFEKIEGSRPKAIENLKLVVEGGRYYRPLAKTLLAAIYVREKQPQQALILLRELGREFPANPLFMREVEKTEQRITRSQRADRK
jgi:hypothetical protein